MVSTERRANVAGRAAQRVAPPTEHTTPALRLDQQTVGHEVVRHALGRTDDPFLRAVRSETVGLTSGIDVYNALGSSTNSAMRQRLRRAQQPAQADLQAATSNAGEQLPVAVRRRFEVAFGHDFRHVRVHTSGAAATAADALSAHAFALGADLFFSTGAFAPYTPTGERLLAHELTHVVQFDQGRLPTGGGVSSPSDPSEQEAYQNEARIVSALPDTSFVQATATDHQGSDDHITSPESQTAHRQEHTDAPDDAHPSSGPMPPEQVADVLAASARGERVSPEDLTAAQLTMDTLDDAGVSAVAERLRATGRLREVMLSGDLTEDENNALLDSVDGEVRISITVLHGVRDVVVNEQVEWMTRLYARHGLRVVVVSRARVNEVFTTHILGGHSDEAALDFELDGDGESIDPGQEARLALEAAWRQNSDSDATHVVFVPRLSPAGEGVNIDEGSYDIATPGVLVSDGSNASVMGHEVGHHLGLEHVGESEEGEETSSDPQERNYNLMFPHSGDRAELTAEQARILRRSWRTTLLPGGTVRDQGDPAADRPHAPTMDETIDAHNAR